MTKKKDYFTKQEIDGMFCEEFKFQEKSWHGAMIIHGITLFLIGLTVGIVMGLII